jgi:hypothetical protein
MVLRVLDALRASQAVGACLLCGPPGRIVETEPVFQGLISSGAARWVPPQATPSSSASAALELIARDTPVLLTTADHALLQPEVVDHFCRQAAASGCDVVAALASHEVTVARFPGMRRTRTRFSDGAVCGCNLYAFLTPAGRIAADFWRRVESHRKRPLKMIAELGWTAVLRYALGLLPLRQAIGHVSDRMGIRVGALMIPFPEAAVDVDSVSDWRFAQRIVSQTGVGRELGIGTER